MPPDCPSFPEPSWATLGRVGEHSPPTCSNLQGLLRPGSLALAPRLSCWTHTSHNSQFLQLLLLDHTPFTVSAAPKPLQIANSHVKCSPDQTSTFCSCWTTRASPCPVAGHVSTPSASRATLQTREVATGFVTA